MSNNLEDIFSEDISIIAQDLKQFYDGLEGKTILIAGGKGFLGTYFTNVLIRINQILSKPMKIIVLDSLITSKDKKELNNFNVDFLEQDISERFEISEDVDYIIHAASIASPPTYRKFPIKTIDVNYQGTKNLLEILIKIN